MKKVKIKEFFKKVKKFSLFDYLLVRKITTLFASKELKKELIIYQQGILKDAERMKIGALRAISNLADEIKVIEHNIENMKKIK